MHKKKFYILCYFVFCCLQSTGQTLLIDTLRARSERQEDFFIRIPARYREMCALYNLSRINDADSFSLRLWTGGMFGHYLTTLTNIDGRWTSHSYKYDLHSAIRELELKPRISNAEFLARLHGFDFDALISQFQIKDFEDNVSDGTRYTLEIIVGKKYKVVQYHSPELFADKGNSNFAGLIKLFENYFYTDDY